MTGGQLEQTFDLDLIVEEMEGCVNNAICITAAAASMPWHAGRSVGDIRDPIAPPDSGPAAGQVVQGDAIGPHFDLIEGGSMQQAAGDHPVAAGGAAMDRQRL